MKVFKYIKYVGLALLLTTVVSQDVLSQPRGRGRGRVRNAIERLFGLPGGGSSPASDYFQNDIVWSGESGDSITWDSVYQYSGVQYLRIQSEGFLFSIGNKLLLDSLGAFVMNAHATDTGIVTTATGFDPDATGGYYFEYWEGLSVGELGTGTLIYSGTDSTEIQGRKIKIDVPIAGTNYAFKVYQFGVDTVSNTDTTQLDPIAVAPDFFAPGIIWVEGTDTTQINSIYTDADSSNLLFQIDGYLATVAQGGALNPITVAYLAAMTEPWTGDTLVAFQTMMTDLGGWLDTMKVFQLYANTTEADALLNVVNPGTYDADNPTSTSWVRMRYFEGNSTDDYISTNFNPTTASIPQDDATYSVGLAYNLQESNYMFGTNSTNETRAYVRNTSNGSYAYVNAEGPSTGTGIYNSMGHWMFLRYESATARVYRNGYQEFSQADASTGVSDSEFHILTYNGAAGYSGNKAAYFFALNVGISEAQAYQIVEPIETFLDYIGGGIMEGPMILNDGYTLTWAIADTNYIESDGSDSVTVWHSAMHNGLDLNAADETGISPSYDYSENPDSVSFDGIKQYMYDYQGQNTQPTAYHMVFRLNSYTLNDQILGGSASIRGNIKETANNSLTMANATALTTSNNAVVYGQWHLGTFIFNGDNSYIKIDGLTKAYGVAGGSDPLGLGLGSTGGGGSDPAHMAVKEVITRISLTGEDDIYDYLWDKYYTDLAHSITQAYVSAMTDPWTGDTLQRFDAMVKSLDSLGYFFDSAYVFYMCANTTEADAYLNVLRDSSKYDATESGSVAFTRLQHIQGDATSAHVATGLNLLTAGAPQNRITAGIGIADNQQDSYNVFGNSTSATHTFGFSPRQASDQVYAYINGPISNFPSTNSIGHWAMSRSDASNQLVFKNGSQVGTQADASTGVDDSEIHLFENSGSASESDNQVVYFYVIKGGITEAQSAAIKTPIEKFLDYIGAGIE